MINTILCALGLAYAGMASLSLAMDRHHGQVWGRDAAPNVRRALQLASASRTARCWWPYCCRMRPDCCCVVPCWQPSPRWQVL